MKITKEKLKQIIKEETNKALTEGYEGESGGDWYNLLRKEAAGEAHESTDPDRKGHGPDSRDDVEYAIETKVREALEAIQSGYGELMHELDIDFSVVVRRWQPDLSTKRTPDPPRPGGKTFEVPGGDITYSGTS